MTGSQQQSDNKAGIQLSPSRKDWRESESLFAFLSKYAENSAYSKQIHNNVAKIFKIIWKVFASLKRAVPWTQ